MSADFSDYKSEHAYRGAVDEAIDFCPAEAEFFIERKARHLEELAARALGDPARLDAIDVGCGPGETDRFLEGSFRSLAGVDIAIEPLERATQANPWAEYRHYPEHDPIPFDDGSFDLSFAICVLHHVPPAHRDAFVAEMARVTRPGGLVAIFEHNPWNPLTRLAVNRCEFDDDAVLISRRRLRRLLARSLRLVEDRYIVFFTSGSDRYDRMEHRLARIPLGAQYYVAARRPAGAA